MIIRKMNRDDINAVAAIESTVLDGWSENGILSTYDAPSARCFVAQKGEKVCAFCAFTLVADEANIDAVSVDESMRKKGVAYNMLEHALHAVYTEGAKNVFLEVRSQNTAAIRLYEKLGFITSGKRKGFYKKPDDDAIIMTRGLSE